MKYFAGKYKFKGHRTGRPGIKNTTKMVDQEVVKDSKGIKHCGGTIRKKGLIVVKKNSIRSYSIFIPHENYKKFRGFQKKISEKTYFERIKRTKANPTLKPEEIDKEVAIQRSRLIKQGKIASQKKIQEQMMASNFSDGKAGANKKKNIKRILRVKEKLDYLFKM